MLTVVRRVRTRDMQAKDPRRPRKLERKLPDDRKCTRGLLVASSKRPGPAPGPPLEERMPDPPCRDGPKTNRTLMTGAVTWPEARKRRALWGVFKKCPCPPKS